METPTLLTSEEFAARYSGPEHKRTELVHGEVREVTPASGLHGRLCKRLLVLLSNHVDAAALGDCFTEATGFRLRVPDAAGDTVRSPDVAFVRSERIPGIPARGFVPFAPDLAVEVLSPDERADDVLEKLADYLGAGVALVWIVDARARTVTVHSPHAASRVLRATDTLDGAPVVPGFTTPVGALFEGLPTER